MPRLAGRDVPAWVIVAALGAATAGAVCWAQYRHAAQGRDGAPDWLRAGQPPDVAVWQLPAALGAAGAPRARSWPPTWAPMTGGDSSAWSWAGADEIGSTG